VKTPREINKGDQQGLTPLHYAVMRGRLAVLQMLLASPDVDVNVRDSSQRTPMMLAVARGDEAAGTQLCCSSVASLLQVTCLLVHQYKF